MTIDILQLIDRLEELLDRGWRVPLASRVVIDEDMFLNIIDQMRITIPQEIQLAQEMLRERDRQLARAQEEAAQVIAQAREEAARQVEHLNLRAAAEADAREVVRQAEREAQRIRAGADEYAEGQLRELGRQVASLLATIRNGLELLDARRAELQAGGPRQEPPADPRQPEDSPSDRANGRGEARERVVDRRRRPA